MPRLVKYRWTKFYDPLCLYYKRSPDTDDKLETLENKMKEENDGKCGWSYLANSTNPSSDSDDDDSTEEDDYKDVKKNQPVLNSKVQKLSEKFPPPTDILDEHYAYLKIIYLIRRWKKKMMMNIMTEVIRMICRVQTAVIMIQLKKEIKHGDILKRIAAILLKTF